MRHYKQKTLALIIASTLTVVGAFGASNYKNSIMSLKFEGEPTGTVKMTVMTKINYANEIIPVKRDAGTYIITLPDTNSEMTAKPELAGNIESVDIRTMPYTTSSNGYTKITIKTAANTPLKAQKALYIPEIKPETPSNNNAENKPEPQVEKNAATPTVKPSTDSAPVQKEIIPETNNAPQKAYNNEFGTGETKVDNIPVEQNTNSQDSSSQHSMEIVYLIFGALLIITVSVYLFIKSTNKISEIIGEQNKIELNDEETKPAQKEIKKQEKKIRKTINNLDRMYKKPVSMPIKNINTPKAEENIPSQENIADNSDIIDLDELFMEQTKQNEPEENETDSLDDFLADFFKDEPQREAGPSIDDEIDKNKEIDKRIDELFSKIKNISDIKFNAHDIENMNRLLNVEIHDEYINELKNTSGNTIKDKKERTIESMVSDLLDIHNITFTREDVDAIEKLMSIEIDKDFVTNIQTNPILTKKMESDILKGDIKKHNTREILTLRVRESLPDLSKEIAKGLKIESNAKPETIFYEKGYDVSILTTKGLPDLATEIINKNLEYVPSTDIVHEDNSWAEKAAEVPTIQVAKDLPDLEDVKAHPQKYRERKSKAKADAETLLKNLDSVVFKPIYEENKNNSAGEDKPSDSEPENNTVIENNDNTVMQEDEAKNNLDENIKTDTESAQKPMRSRIDIQTEELLKLIDTQKEERIQSTENTQKEKPAGTKKPSKEQKTVLKVKECTLDGVHYDIIAYSNFTNDIGCCLATSPIEGYAILGFIGDKIFKVKHYEKIKTSKIQSRFSEKLDDGTLRYIVRIGIHKFILDVSDDKMEYVMDLC